MKDLLKGARAALERREGNNGGSVTEQMEAGTTAKKELIKAGSLLFGLADGLGVMKEKGRLGEGELRRRKDLLAAAKEEKAWLDQWALRSAGSRGRDQHAGGGGGNASESDRAALGIGGDAARRPVGRTIGRPLPETERTRELDNEGVLQLQKEEMKLQDQRVNEVGLSVQRLKANAIAIDEELTYQLGQLDHLNDLVDSHERKLAVADRRVKGL
jgi:regulator of vacuolar morphogenesis